MGRRRRCCRTAFACGPLPFRRAAAKGGTVIVAVPPLWASDFVVVAPPQWAGNFFLGASPLWVGASPMWVGASLLVAGPPFGAGTMACPGDHPFMGVDDLPEYDRVAARLGIGLLVREGKLLRAGFFRPNLAEL